MAAVVPGDKTVADRASAAPTQVFVRSNVPFDAPWNWLGAGWRDLWTVPGLSLAYGAVFALAALALAVGLLSLGWQSLVLVLAGGFLLVGPMMAVGLYEVSRRLETGEAVDVRDAMFVGVKSPGQLAIMGVVLMIAYLAWVATSRGGLGSLRLAALGPRLLEALIIGVPILLFGSVLAAMVTWFVRRRSPAS